MAIFSFELPVKLNNIRYIFLNLINKLYTDIWITYLES